MPNSDSVLNFAKSFGTTRIQKIKQLLPAQGAFRDSTLASLTEIETKLNDAKTLGEVWSLLQLIKQKHFLVWQADGIEKLIAYAQKLPEEDNLRANAIAQLQDYRSKTIDKNQLGSFTELRALAKELDLSANKYLDRHYSPESNVGKARSKVKALCG